VRNEVEDVYFAHLVFESGAVGAIFGGVAGHGEPTGMRDGAVVYGTSGCIKGGDVVRDDGERIVGEALFDREAPPGLKERWFSRGIQDNFGLEWLDFLQAIEGRREMDASGEEGLRDLSCSLAVLESSSARRPVRFADVFAGRVEAYQREINEHYGL
jgi:predicted dehydrogenase